VVPFQALDHRVHVFAIPHDVMVRQREVKPARDEEGVARAGAALGLGLGLVGPPQIRIDFVGLFGGARYSVALSLMALAL